MPPAAWIVVLAFFVLYSSLKLSLMVVFEKNSAMMILSVFLILLTCLFIYLDLFVFAVIMIAADLSVLAFEDLAANQNLARTLLFTSTAYFILSMTSHYVHVLVQNLRR